MAHIPAMQPFSITFNISGVPNVILHSDILSTTYSSSPYITFSLNRIACQCGDGVINDGTLEQCDLGSVNNSNPLSCCTQDCLFAPSTTICHPASPTNPCSAPVYCQANGLNAECPPVPPSQTCNCTAPFTGPTCTQVRCDLLTTCSACNNASFKGACDFCCESSTCVTAGNCQTPMPASCPACGGSSCVSGTCVCGACVCKPGFGGATCDETVDCTGNVTTHPKTIDVCGVCGGNGLSCIGCDGLLYGAKYDACGVCGGNGSSCFNPCSGIGDCGNCMENNACGWCTGTTQCIKRVPTASNPNAVCPQPFATTCQAVSTAVLVGATIGAGVIAAIVIGAIAAIVGGIIGGKKGYDAYMNNKNNIHGAQENPMYNDSGRSGRNPMFEAKT